MVSIIRTSSLYNVVNRYEFQYHSFNVTWKSICSDEERPAIDQLSLGRSFVPTFVPIVITIEFACKCIAGDYMEKKQEFQDGAIYLTFIFRQEIQWTQDVFAYSHVSQSEVF